MRGSPTAARGPAASTATSRPRYRRRSAPGRRMARPAPPRRRAHRPAPPRTATLAAARRAGRRRRTSRLSLGHQRGPPIPWGRPRRSPSAREPASPLPTRSFRLPARYRARAGRASDQSPPLLPAGGQSLPPRPLSASAAKDFGSVLGVATRRRPAFGTHHRRMANRGATSQESEVSS